MQFQSQGAAVPTLRWELFWALSRTQHGLLDLATPAFAALLWLGGFPSLQVTLLGIITAFAGYTAVYALNDLVDVVNDRAKLAAADPADKRQYLDAAAGVRHPLAQGMLSLPAGAGWVVFWSALALAGAYALNPVCFFLFLAGAGLEVIYCLLLRVTALRTLVSGLVKTTGGIAAVYAVDPAPSLWFMLGLWAWLFCWEIGGQNVPADWHDVEQDRELGARTLPVVYGSRRASLIILCCLSLATLLSLAVLALAPLRVHWLMVTAAWAAGIYLLVLPALDLWRSRAGIHATRLFNRASYYPLAMLLVVLVDMVINALY